jgi:hypothetical protein
MFLKAGGLTFATHKFNFASCSRALLRAFRWRSLRQVLEEPAVEFRMAIRLTARLPPRLRQAESKRRAVTWAATLAVRYCASGLY